MEWVCIEMTFIKKTYRQKNINTNPLRKSLLGQPRGFFVWFSNPTAGAHLQVVKEQSRITSIIGRVAIEAVKRCVKTYNTFFLSKTSKKQYLPVLAMSNLTTSDLEINSISIVTSVDVQQAFNTAHADVIGEESQMANVLTV